MISSSEKLPDGLLHPVEIALELFLRRLPPTLQETPDRHQSRQEPRSATLPIALSRNGRVLLIESHVVVEDGAGVWVRADQAVEHRLSGGQCVVVGRFLY